MLPGDVVDLRTQRLVAVELQPDGRAPVADRRLLHRDHALELVRQGAIALEELPRLFSQEMLGG